MASPKILIVDDDPDIVELLAYNLEKEGYTIATAPDGKKALEVAPAFLPDLVLLDVMMPLMDGIETGRQLRTMPAFKKTHLVFLTARNEELSEIAAFDIGANDYIVKPIKPRALMSRINAFFRHETDKTDTPNTHNIANLKINKSNYSVLKPDGSTLILPKKEFELLWFLAQSPNKVFGREVLLKNIWGDVYVVERTVDVHIRKLREKVGEEYIRTLKGVGYMFVNE